MTDTIAPPTLPKGVKKPNDEAYKKELEEINARIDKFKKQSDAVREKINQLPAKSDNSRREELKVQMAELREKQAEIKKSRQAVYEQLDLINDSIRKKVGSIKSFQNKVPYKTKAEVDDRIRELESKIEGGVRLVEEKKMLQEISLLKRNREQVEGLDEQQAAIDKERTIHADIKGKMDDSEAKKISEQYEKLDAEFKQLKDEASQGREVRNKLYDERTRLRGLLDEEYNQLRTLRDEHRKANDEYYNFLRQLREYKKEQERLRKVQEETDKRKEAAEQELEFASMPAFEHEIILCDNLAKYLQSFIGGSAQGNAAPKLAPATNNAPEGFVLLKKSDADEDYFAGAGKKKSKSSANKEKKTDTLKLPLATLEDFFEIKVTVPTKISEIPATLEKLKDRKTYYEAEQPKVTAANKKKAEEKIAAMLKKEEEEKKAKEEAPVAEQPKEDN
ncbi:hypothetical protein DFQ28_008494 [Apophysomyces sp. BC1034]|nr:hypothetical protein DFQ30_009289 [Apophysomyces sp. BC1015]KAG0181817.1 hypothetical protein DFQ29_006928 [Apophysomyces sp. BC1021]KAG0192618.1 hypothetical protein DFQ28_008494 [Apophysomyces sp. BC1034]